MRHAVHFQDLERLALSCEPSPLNTEWGPERIVSRNDIDSFANVTNNFQWIHEDDERCARESPYGRVIAHGLLLVSLIPSLLPETQCRIIGHSVRIIRRIDTLRLPSPVFADERVHVRAHMVRAYPAPSGKGTIIERDVELWSLQGTKPAVTCRLSLQYF